MPTGTRTTYTDSNIAVRSVSGLLSMIDWTEAPLLQLLGTNNEKRFRLKEWPRTKYEWLEDSMSPRSGTTAEALDGSETEITVASGQGAYLKSGDIIKIGTEKFYVSSVSGDDVTVARGWGSTSATTHNSGAAWNLVTQARREGADYTTGHTTTLDLPYNYTSTFSEAVTVTGSEEVNVEYGITDQMMRQVAKLIGGGEGVGTKGKAGKLAILLQGIFYYGERVQGADNESRSAGGFETFVTTNTVDKSNNAVTRKDFEDLMEDCFLAGGTPDTVSCNSWVYRKFTDFYEGQVTTDIDQTRGGARITMVRTPLGDFELAYDRWSPVDRAYMYEKDKIGWVEYRPFQIKDRAPGGDYSVKEVVGEYGFVVCNETAHGYLYNISTSR